MWKRMSGVVLLGGMFLFGTPARGEDLEDLLTRGRQAFRSGKYDDAEHYHRLAVPVAESTQDEVKLAEATGDLGGVLLAKGQYWEARLLLLKALGPLRHVPASPYLPVSLNNLGFLS